jgi:Ca-activated chloride channel family protein
MPTRIPRFDPAPDDRRPATLRSSRGDLPLRAVAVRAEIAGTTAGVEVEQTFANPYGEALEVSYVFPLPELAAVTRCELVVSDRVVAARLDERATAQQAFAEAVETGRQAALAEQERPGVFTLTLGNLPPRERATVRFAMAYPLPREDGRHAFRFPLVVAERYVPGALLDEAPVGHGTHGDTTEVPDASRLTPPRLAPGAERPVLTAEIVLNHGALGIHEVECSLHAVEQLREPGRRIVRLAPDQAMDRDLVVRFRLGGEAIRSQLCIERDAAGDEGTFQLTVVPPAAPIRRRPRDVVLVLDRSGSMAGWKIVAARRALVRMIDTLGDADRFVAYAFGSETIASADLAFDRLHAATAGHRARAAEFLHGVSAAGGTEMLHPLTLAVELLASADPARERWIVLVTDGQVANEDALVAAVARAPHLKVQALGIDDALNTSLLHRLASATGGRAELVAQLSELEAALDRLHLLLASPALERVVVAGDAILDGTVVPAGRLHAFPGVPLVVRGRYRGALRSLSVTARGPTEPFALDVAAEPAELPALAACWAREQLLALEDRLAARAGDRDDIAAEIVRTSLRFGVLCRFTAFVAVDEHGPVGTVATRHVQQPVEPTLPPARNALDLRITPDWRPPSDSMRHKTQCGTVTSTSPYLTADQVRGFSLGPPHEVYALGRLLWELLTGRALFEFSETFQFLVQVAQSVLPEPLLPPALESLAPALRRALAVDPARRHATPGAFADDIEAAVTPASPAEVAAWLAALAGDLARQRLLDARIAGPRAPAHGYLLLACCATTGRSKIYAAVRSGPRGPELIALRRRVGLLATFPDEVERFLAEASVAVDGIAHTDDAGLDAAGGVFRAQPFVCGIDLAQVLAILHQRHAAAPPAIAVAVIGAAARALQRALSLPTRSGAIDRVIGEDLAPSSLRIAIDGRPVWTSLGVAPSADFLAPRRDLVPLTTVAGLRLDGAPRPPGEPMVGRSVVVPRSTVAAAPAIVPASPPRPRRLRWWF